jgi:COP9 signalosome complex subunit 6
MYLVIGALLGNRENRKISIVNSFELVLLSEADSENANPVWPISQEFFETRQAQCKRCKTALRCIADLTVAEVFPSLSVVGWYTVGTELTSDDVQLQKHVSLRHETGNTRTCG